MYKIIVADPTKCIGCRICELACSASKKNAFIPRMSRIKTVKRPKVDISMACRFCEKPMCVRLCPKDALTQDKETGVIVVDEMRCDGCGWCVQFCEFGSKVLDLDTGVAVSCDLCEGEPECVKYCPTEALELTTLEVLSNRVRESKIIELFLEETGK